MPQSPYRIVLVEDDLTLQQSLRRRLDDIDGFVVVYATDRCKDYLAYLQNADFDLLITDLGLPDGHGHDLIDATRRMLPEVDIMVFTVFGEDRLVVDAIRRGATGYLLKDDSAIEMEAAIQSLRAGESPISPRIARFLIGQFTATAVELAEPLSERETEVLQLAAKGYSNKEIADLLGLSAHTVASHTKQIYLKLAVNSRNEAIFEATRLGVLR